jgi:hypothetical protein
VTTIAALKPAAVERTETSIRMCMKMGDQRYTISEAKWKRTGGGESLIGEDQELFKIDKICLPMKNTESISY